MTRFYLDYMTVWLVYEWWLDVCLRNICVWEGGERSGAVQRSSPVFTLMMSDESDESDRVNYSSILQLQSTVNTDMSPATVILPLLLLLSLHININTGHDCHGNHQDQVW